MAFHAAHRLIVAHSPTGHARLGQLVAAAREQPRLAMSRSYQAEFMAALAVPATRERQASDGADAPRPRLTR